MLDRKALSPDQARMAPARGARLTIDPAAIRAAIAPRTKAVMPVHYGGLACRMDEILSIAREHGLKVVEDAAHALPTTWQGTLVGQLPSDVAVVRCPGSRTRPRAIHDAHPLEPAPWGLAH